MNQPKKLQHYLVVRMIEIAGYPANVSLIPDNKASGARLHHLFVGVGPSGMSLDLRHKSRGSAAMLDELARLILNLCRIVPQVDLDFGYLVYFKFQSHRMQ